MALLVKAFCWKFRIIGFGVFVFMMLVVGVFILKIVLLICWMILMG